MKRRAQYINATIGSQLRSHLPNGHKSNINNKKRTTAKQLNYQVQALYPFLLVCIAIITWLCSYNSINETT